MGDIDRIHRLPATDSTVESVKNLRQKIQRRQEEEPAKHKHHEHSESESADQIELHDEGDGQDQPEMQGPKLLPSPGKTSRIDISA